MALTIKQLNGKIKTIAGQKVKMRNLIQEVVVESCPHAFDDKNVDPFTNLVNACQGAVDVKALIHWIEKHAPAIWRKDEAKFKFNKSFVGAFNREYLMEQPWWENAVKAKDVSSSLDMLDALRSFIKRMEREAAKEIDGKKMEVSHAELLDGLKKLANDTEYNDKEVRAAEVKAAVEAAS